MRPGRLPRPARCLIVAVLLLGVAGPLVGSLLQQEPGLEGPPAAPPPTLTATGLYAQGSTSEVAAGNLPFSPQYPLWSDGATKRRWIHLPPGTAIDVSDPNAWVFPVGTKFWKEFAFGRPVETRYMERAADGRWLFAAYVWNADGREAVLAPDAGVRGAHEIRPGLWHDVPGRLDCAACHEGRPVPVLGFSELQLSTDRDPLAPHAERPAPGSLDLALLQARGLLVSRRTTFDDAPRIPARSPRERAALGYLHANCGACHTAGGPLGDLELDVRLDAPLEEGREAAHVARAFETTLGRSSRFRLTTRDGVLDTRLLGGDPEHSVLWRRLASRSPLSQMPPLGTKAVDQEAVALLQDWIREDLRPLLAAPAVAHVAPAAPSPSPTVPKE